MNILEFKRVISSFADRQADVSVEKGVLLTEIRGEIIEATLSMKEGNLFVSENDVEESAISWISNRIACLPQLARRIEDYIPDEENFIDPSGKLLDELEFDPEEQEKSIPKATDSVIDILSRRIPGTSNVVYLTSDAGEGKTTIINKLANLQASRFKRKESDWLLVPIPLGGRPFLRLDDIVIASIVNNLRFRYFYYDSFIELVRLGLIVPAFDGFEEMFMLSSTGEALSATGNLMNKMESSGTVLIAARKAYFDYKSFGSQAKLFDSISTSVSFARLEINRWDKSQFLEYAESKGIKDAESVYNSVVDRLKNPNHPILTRPVLVKQLLDVFTSSGDTTSFVSKLDSSSNYFPNFVHAIIEREARLKWIDSSGEPHEPLLTTDQHYELLASLSEEMWYNDTDSLQESMLDLLTEMYSEETNLSVKISRQIKERIKQHALIVKTEMGKTHYQFDHDEFRQFFLGVAISEKIKRKHLTSTKSLLKKSTLPLQTCQSVISRIKKESSFSLEQTKSFVDEVMHNEGPASFVKENAGNIILRLINNEEIENLTLENYEIPSNAFSSINLNNVQFVDCHFQSNSISNSKLRSCRFASCTFDRLEIDRNSQFESVVMTDCEINSIHDANNDSSYFNPIQINQFLKDLGIQLVEEEIQAPDSNSLEKPENDENLILTEKALRKFIRSTQINDSIFRLRLGNRGAYFIQNILPQLISHNILIEIDYLGGGGNKRRFKLGVPFSHLERAFIECKGDYNSFLKYFQ